MKRQRFYCFIYFAQNTDIHLSGNSVKLHDWPITGSQLLALSSERVNPDSEGDASKVEIQKMEAQYWYSLLQIPNKRDWWHENSRAQKWISEQSPVRCRGTRSHYFSGYYPCETKTSQETEKNLWNIFRVVTDAKSYFCERFVEIWQVLWRIIMESSDKLSPIDQRQQIAERAVRRVKEGTSAVLLQSGLIREWRPDSMKCFYYLQKVQNYLANGKSQIWSKIWRIIQRTNYTIWRTDWISPRTQRKKRKRIHQFGKKLSQIFFIGCVLFAVRNLGRRYSNYWGWRIG